MFIKKKVSLPVCLSQVHTNEILLHKRRMAILDDSELLEPQEWSFPVPIYYGPGRLVEIGALSISRGVTKPLIVTDRGSSHLPFIKQLQQYLTDAGLSWGIFYDISPNPRDDEIGAGCKTFRDGRHDAVIAIGGGSAMDGGKSICLTANNSFDLWDFEFEQPVPTLKNTEPFPILITIPTTAGTGAETESTAMVTNVEKGMKFCIWHPDLKPSFALLDPEVTIGLPPTLTAWTGADAMTHAIEAYLVPGFHPFCDGLALQGLALVSKWLSVAAKEPGNMFARGAMIVGSCLAGASFLKGLGMVHAISHMVGAEYNTQHGLTNAIVLPVVLRFNLENNKELEPKVKKMAEAMELSDHSVGSFIAEVERILDAIGIPKSLSAIGVPLDCSQRIAEKALKDSAAATNPVQATVDQVRTLIEASITKARD
jgi:alcohol dehydrogenase class IV